MEEYVNVKPSKYINPKITFGYTNTYTHVWCWEALYYAKIVGNCTLPGSEL